MLGCQVGLEDPGTPALPASLPLQIEVRAHPADRPPPPHFGLCCNCEPALEPGSKGATEVPGLLGERRVVDATDCPCRTITDRPHLDSVLRLLGSPPAIDLTAEAFLGTWTGLTGQFCTTTVPPTGSGMSGVPTVVRLDDHVNGLQVTWDGIMRDFEAEPIEPAPPHEIDVTSV